MPDLPVSALSLRPHHLRQVSEILAATSPTIRVLAYGSRINGSSHEASDLDLAVTSPQGAEAEAKARVGLLAAFVESNLPIRVDVVAFHTLPPSFQAIIEHQQVILQEGCP